MEIGLPSSNWEKSTAYAAFVCLGRLLAVLTHESSDVDFVVEVEKGRNLFDLFGVRLDLRSYLGVEGDVVTSNSLPYIRTRVLDEAKRIEPMMDRIRVFLTQGGFGCRSSFV